MGLLCRILAPGDLEREYEAAGVEREKCPACGELSCLSPGFLMEGCSCGWRRLGATIHPLAALLPECRFLRDDVRDTIVVLDCVFGRFVEIDADEFARERCDVALWELVAACWRGSEPVGGRHHIEVRTDDGARSVRCIRAVR